MTNDCNESYFIHWAVQFVLTFSMWDMKDKYCSQNGSSNYALKQPFLRTGFDELFKMFWKQANGLMLENSLLVRNHGNPRATHYILGDVLKARYRWLRDTFLRCRWDGNTKIRPNIPGKLIGFIVQ